jgi:hypothetical protein
VQCGDREMASRHLRFPSCLCASSQQASSLGNDIIFAILIVNLLCMCSAGGGTGGLAAKDQAGNDIKASSYLKTHLPGDYSLAQGLKVRAFSDFLFHSSQFNISSPPVPQ